VYYLFVVGTDFGAFSRSIPKEGKPKVEVGQTMCGRWLASRGHKVVHHYRLLLDRLEVDDVRWSTYDDHREICSFQLIITYSG
jgi:hypothetical protein